MTMLLMKVNSSHQVPPCNGCTSSCRSRSALGPAGLHSRRGVEEPDDQQHQCPGTEDIRACSSKDNRGSTLQVNMLILAFSKTFDF